MWLFLAITLAIAASLYGESADSIYAGADACRPCHTAEYAKQSKSHHALALRPVAASPLPELLKSHKEGEFTVTYQSGPKGVQVTIGSGSESADGLIQWAFGANAQAMTPVGVSDGRYFEQRFSYFASAGKLGLTFGHPANVHGVTAGLGLWQDTATIFRCFNCHSTGAQKTAAGLDLTGMRPGVTCERCHGPGAAHIKAAEDHASVETIRKALVNPGRFPARAQVEMCGECHRLPSPDNDVPEPEVEDPVSVRFAPVGLMASRCFQASKSLRCTTCHDPHSDARPRTDPAYASACSGCHTAASAAASHCARATNKDCVSCHMHQARLGPFLKFTDHRIR